MQFHFWRRFCAIVFLSASVVVFPAGVRADAKDELSGQGGMPVPLQQVIRKERPRGPIFIAVPVAYVFGLGGDRSPTYCSPSIRATNSSNANIEELIVGIDFHTKTTSAGGSVSRYANIKIGAQDTHYFYQLTVADCRGLEGVASVLRCVYASGEDCTADVKTIEYGTIPLRMKPR